MIASISKGSNYERLIDYHEQKCSEGKAQLLLNDTLSKQPNASSYTKSFDNHFSNYDKETMKNKVAHIALSLPKGENLTNSQFIEIGQEYMLKMGYKNCPHLIYRHYDKEGMSHIHILVSTLDWNGKKVVEFNDYKRSQDISRSIEKKFNLRTTEYSKTNPNVTLTETNFRKFYMHNAIKKASHAYSSKQFIANFFSDQEKKFVFSKNALTQQQLFHLLGEERFNTLYKHLHSKGYFNTLFKDELSRKLDNILTYSNTYQDFVNECKKEGIYVRKLTDKNQKPYLKYGISDDNFYTKDTNLSARFRYDKVKERFNLSEENGLKSKTQYQQSEYIRKHISQNLGKGTFEAFEKSLADRGIETIIYEDKKGAYDISFKDLNCNSPINFNISYFDQNLNIHTLLNNFEQHDAAIKFSYIPAEPVKEDNIILPPVEPLGVQDDHKKHQEDLKDLSGKPRRKRRKKGLSM